MSASASTAALPLLVALRGLLDTAIGESTATPAAAPASAPAFLSVADFAARIEATEKSVRQMIADGMPSVRPRPRLTRIPVAKAETWMAERSRPTPSASVDAARRRATLDAHRGDPH